MLSANNLKDDQMVVAAYAELSEKRGGAIEIGINEDKQGFGLGKRHKKRAAAQHITCLYTILGRLFTKCDV